MTNLFFFVIFCGALFHSGLGISSASSLVACFALRSDELRKMKMRYQKSIALPEL